MENTLFIGNGLNRSLSSSISWGNLLKKISEELNVDYNCAIAMPMEYERLINSYLKSNPNKENGIHEKTKWNIAEQLSAVKLPDYCVHKKILKLDVNAIMTTNYDFLLEYTFNSDYIDMGEKHPNEKYLKAATSKYQGIKFYHPHGIASRYKTLCLGYEHYMGIVENIRRELNAKVDHNANEMKIKQILFEKAEKKDTWFERFYTSNVAFIGFGLTDCESDIWWLLAHRAFLYYSDYCNIKTVMKNNIVFYDIINDVSTSNPNEEQSRMKEEADKSNRHMLLSSEHVEVKKYNLSSFDGSYIDAYSAIFENIKSSGITK